LKSFNLRQNIKQIVYRALNPFRSFDWITLNCARHSAAFIKEGNLAVFTQTNNEGELLLYWEAYYGKLVGYENLFVINNGGNDDSCSRLNPKTLVVNIQNNTFDMYQAAQAQGYFQRFLLQHYKWVLKVDVDEFMVFEGDFLEKLDQLSSGIYIPERTVAVVHDKNTEAAFNYERSIFQQRAHFVEEQPSMKKPSLASEPATWTPGNHCVYEKFTVLPGLWMLHLRYFDFERLLAMLERRAILKVTATYDATTRGVSAYRGKDAPAIYNIAETQLSDMLIKERVVIPDWFATKI